MNTPENYQHLARMKQEMDWYNKESRKAALISAIALGVGATVLYGAAKLGLLEPKPGELHNPLPVENVQQVMQAPQQYENKFVAVSGNIKEVGKEQTTYPTQLYVKSTGKYPYLGAIPGHKTYTTHYEFKDGHASAQQIEVVEESGEDHNYNGDVSVIGKVKDTNPDPNVQHFVIDATEIHPTQK